MAHLVAIQTSNGEWQAFVIAQPSNRFVGDIDVTGREVPSFCYMRAWDGCPRPRPSGWRRASGACPNPPARPRS